MIPKNSFDCSSFDFVTGRRRGSVGVHERDILRLQPCILHGSLHGPHCAFSAGGRLCDMMRIGGEPDAADLGIDLRISFKRVSELFKNQNSRSFSHNEPVPILIKWAARLLGSVIARRERFHRIESADAHRTNGRFGSSRQHHVGIAALKQNKGIANGM